MKHTALAIIAAALLQACAIPGAQPLVSADEAVRYRGAEGYADPDGVRSRGATPEIVVRRPAAATEQKLASPFAIDVRFNPLADAAIVPQSFKVLYGALKLDITSRITKLVQVTPEGFSFDRAQIPAGKHKLLLQVQDEKGRVGERDLRFEIE